VLGLDRDVPAGGMIVRLPQSYKGLEQHEPRCKVYILVVPHSGQSSLNLRAPASQSANLLTLLEVVEAVMGIAR
jgi:hypothetical protein